MYGVRIFCLLKVKWFKVLLKTKADKIILHSQLET